MGDWRLGGTANGNGGYGNGGYDDGWGTATAGEWERKGRDGHHV